MDESPSSHDLQIAPSLCIATSLLLLVPALAHRCRAVPKDHGAIGAGEGPAWKDGSLYFTDGKHINRLGPDGKTTVFRHNASNGLLFDREGRLVACESGLRRVTRTEKDGSITVLADRFEGKRFNTPNDLCMDSKGRIYFTDPRYGSREGMEIVQTHNSRGKAQSTPSMIEGVDRINQTGCRHRRRLSHRYRPAKSPASTATARSAPTASSSHQTTAISTSPTTITTPTAAHGSCCATRSTRNGDVKPGTRKVIFDWKDGRGPDGMKMDAQDASTSRRARTRPRNTKRHGSRPAATSFRPPAASSTSSRPHPTSACNCAFGGKDGKTLFITSGGHLWSVPCVELKYRLHEQR
jgi:gluconolactonase